MDRLHFHNGSRNIRAGCCQIPNDKIHITIRAFAITAISQYHAIDERNCHNEDGRIQLRKREFITRSNTQRETKVELFVGRGGAFRRQKRSFP